MDAERPKTKMTPFTATVAIVGLVGAVGLWARGAPAEVPLKIEPAAPAGPKAQGAKAQEPAAPRRLLVQIAGAVRKPGVYPLEPDTRIGEALRQAGGTTPTAAIERLNLAAPLHDGEKLTVPERGVGWVGSAEPPSDDSSEGPALLAPMPVVVQASGPIGARAPRRSRARKKPVRKPDVERPGIVAASGRKIGGLDPVPHVDGPPTKKVRTTWELPPDSVSINADPPEVLATLPGISLAIAREIVAERERRGGFRAFEELLEVRGIGPAKFERIERYLNLARS